MQTVREWVSDWIRRVLPNGQAVSLAIMLIVGCVTVISLGRILMPVFAAGVIAYLLEGLVGLAERHRLPRLISVVIVFNLFMAFLFFVLLALLPLLYQQSMQLVQQLPAWVNKTQVLVMQLPEQYPHFINQDQIYEIVAAVRQELLSYGQAMLTYSYATLVTFPVMLVAFFQWGNTDEFWYLMLAYASIQMLDGVVLVPLLFSEVVNLHPVAIMVAILFFGGIWGFWGVFFAIPLATLVKAVLCAWPRLGDDQQNLFNLNPNQ